MKLENECKLLKSQEQKGGGSTEELEELSQKYKVMKKKLKREKEISEDKNKTVDSLT